MKKIIFVFAVLFTVLNATAQEFQAAGVDVGVTLDIDNDKVEIYRNGEKEVFEMAWITHFPITHSDIGVLSDNIFSIRLKMGLFRRYYTRMVIIHTDYSKEKYTIL